MPPTSEVRAIKRSEAIADFVKQMRVVTGERRAAVTLAVPAMERLVEVMRHKTGQGHTLRVLLYSLWNGQPAALIEVVGLDWQVRKDFTAVLLAFGWEDPRQADCFFYDAIRLPLERAGLWEWFLEAQARAGSPL